MQDDVIEIVKDVLCSDDSIEVTTETRFDALDDRVDYLDMMEIIMRIEDKFQVDISLRNDGVAELEKVGDLIEQLELTEAAI